jgi:hypothetical protein
MPREFSELRRWWAEVKAEKREVIRVTGKVTSMIGAAVCQT